MVIQLQGWHALKGFKNGLQSVLYDHESDHLLACDEEGGKIIKYDPNTGTFSS